MDTMNLFVKDISLKLHKIQANPFEPLSEISKMASIFPSKESYLIYIKNGDILNPYLTLEYQGIMEDDTVYVFSRKLNFNPKCYSFSNKFQKRMHQYEVENNSKLMERLRLADLSFLPFECRKSVKKACFNMGTKQLEYEKDPDSFTSKISFSENNDTKIPQFISDKPLPTCWNIDD